MTETARLPGGARKRRPQHPDESRMTLVEHLVELRDRLFKSVLALAVAFALVVSIGYDTVFDVGELRIVLPTRPSRQWVLDSLQKDLFQVASVQRHAALAALTLAADIALIDFDGAREDNRTALHRVAQP